MNVLGIDPGKTGGVAVLEPDGRVIYCEGVPVLTGASVRGKKQRPQYDVAAYVRMLEEYTVLPEIGGGRSARVYYEHLHAMPLGGCIAHHERGFGQGLILGILTALGASSVPVSPQEWQRSMLHGTAGKDTKQRGIIAAQRLFPGVRLTAADSGLADALLIAEYGRRREAGKAVAA